MSAGIDSLQMKYHTVRSWTKISLLQISKEDHQFNRFHNNSYIASLLLVPITLSHTCTRQNVVWEQATQNDIDYICLHLLRDVGFWTTAGGL
jgi:hypothetical protein